MDYCARCLYPANTAVNINLDENGICAGCRYFDEMENVDWDSRRKILDELLAKYKNSGNTYDCLIPVSGGKDSHYQTYLIKKVYGLRPLLMTFNHLCSPVIGIKNMENIVEKFEVDHVRFTPNPAVIRKLMKYMLKKRADLCWFCQTGVVTAPIQVALQYKIPLIIWGENGWSHLFGVNQIKQAVEFSTEERKRLFMRGVSVEDVLKENPELDERDLSWAIYPSEEEITKVGVRGIYLGNYIKWNQKSLTEDMIDQFGFTARPKARTYNTYADADCHLCSGSNDYLKYLKYGYGRTTDHASQDIREGRITREEGQKLVAYYDHQRPEDLDELLRQLGITEKEFYAAVDPHRDPRVWEKKADGTWVQKAAAYGDPANKVQWDEVKNIVKKLGFRENWKKTELSEEWCF